MCGSGSGSGSGSGMIRVRVSIYKRQFINTQREGERERGRTYI